MTSSGESRPFKIVFLGDTHVGKSSLFYRLVFNKFNQEYRSTTGTDFLSKSFYVKETVCNVQLWDTSGQGKYWCLTEMFWRTSDAAILVYDVNNEKSFNNLSFWLNQCKSKCLNEDGTEKSNFTFIVLGNQIDEEPEKRQVKYETARQWCNENKIRLFYEVSAKETTKVRESIIRLLESILDHTDETIQEGETEIDSPLLQSSKNLNQLTPMPLPKSKGPSCQCCTIM